MKVVKARKMMTLKYQNCHLYVFNVLKVVSFGLSLTEYSSKMPYKSLECLARYCFSSVSYLFNYLLIPF